MTLHHLLYADRLLVTHAQDIPEAKGAYILQIDLPALRMVSIKKFAGKTLPSGRYYYCGSAKGGGGMAARVGRHFKADKPIRWHVDHVTVGGTVTAALLVPDGSECDLVDELMRAYHVTVPLSGFGASDCRRCVSHMVRDMATARALCLPLNTESLRSPEPVQSARKRLCLIGDARASSSGFDPDVASGPVLVTLRRVPDLLA